MAIANALNPIASVCAAALVAPITPQKAAEMVRIARFNATRGEYISPLLSALLPIDGLVNTVLDYAKPSSYSIAHANENLIAAVRYHDRRSLLISLNEGADPDTTNKKHPIPALHNGAQEGFVELVQILVNHHANVNVINKFSPPALHCAAAHNNENSVQIIKILLKHNANINLQASNQLTALMRAVVARCPLTIKLLMIAGADPTITGPELSNQTAWDKAKKNPEIELAMLQGQQIKLDNDLSNMLLKSAVLKQYILEVGIVHLIAEYVTL